MNLENIKSIDPEIFNSIELEINRQESKIELIASENFTSYAVMEAMGSPLTNKYAEGYPGKRYYGGCEYVDITENIAVRPPRSRSWRCCGSSARSCRHA